MPNPTHVNSESDGRTANNAVRHTYRVLSDEEKAQMVALKDIGAAFIAKCQEIGASRDVGRQARHQISEHAAPAAWRGTPTNE